MAGSCTLAALLKKKAQTAGGVRLREKADGGYPGKAAVATIASASLSDMLGEDPDDGTFDDRAGIEQVGSNLLDGVPVGQKLRLPGTAFGTLLTHEFVHRRVADATLDRLVSVHHEKRESQSFEIVSNDFATR